MHVSGVILLNPILHKTQHLDLTFFFQVCFSLAGLIHMLLELMLFWKICGCIKLLHVHQTTENSLKFVAILEWNKLRRLLDLLAQGLWAWEISYNVNVLQTVLLNWPVPHVYSTLGTMAFDDLSKMHVNLCPCAAIQSMYSWEFSSRLLFAWLL